MLNKLSHSAVVLYNFLNFQLNTETKQLSYKKQAVHLTQQNFLLLLVFIENAGSLVDKNTLIKHAWLGRVVQDNTLDQGISKLRKLLNKYEEADYINAGYGKGWQFVPEVKQVNTATQFQHFAIITACFVFLGLAWFFWPTKGSDNDSKARAMVMFVPSEHTKSERWWSGNSVPIIEHYLGQSHNNIIKKYEAIEREIAPDEYLKNFQQLSPDLVVINTSLIQKTEDDIYELTLKIKTPQATTEQKTFTHINLNGVYEQLGNWLTTQYGLTTNDSNVLPDNPLAVQLFMQGINNYDSGDFEKSVDYFKLSLREMPDFDFARLKLAESLKKVNQFDDALSQLKTLQLSPIQLNMKLKVIALIGDIFEIQGHHEKARDLYEATLEQNNNSDHPTLFEIRFYLSDVYFSLADNQAALQQLDYIENHIDQHDFPYLLADTYRQQGQIHFINGQFDSAKRYTLNALQLYTDLGYLAGQIKAYASLSRFLQHQHRYREATGYINKALAIARTMDNKLMVGAMINQLIYLLNTQGHANEAWQLTIEMEQIGLELGFSRMVVAAKHHFAEIARGQRKFTLAMANLNEHLNLAKESNNKRAIHTNNLLRIDFLLDQGISDGVQTLIDLVHQHINETGETRLEPVLSLKQAQLNQLLGQDTHIVALLENALQQAKDSEDGETIIAINQFLAQHHLDSNMTEKAEQYLQLNAAYQEHPTAKQQMLQAEILIRKGQTKKALRILNQAKLQAGDHWFEEQEALLQRAAQTGSIVPPDAPKSE